MEEKKITYKLTDTGHWMARCDHSTNVIELNEREFFKLSPMHQDYIWIHEHVHLLNNVYDESECNRITDEIFLSRAKDEADRRERVNFIIRSNDNSLSKNNFWSMLLVSLVGSLVGLGASTAKNAIANRNAGYYSLGEADQKRYVDNLLSEAFMASLLTDTQSAKDIFWQNLSSVIYRKKEQNFAAWYSNNTFIDEYIEKYENEYGFGFNDITPVNKLAHPQYQKAMRTYSVIAIVLALIVLALVLLKDKK